MTGEWQKTLLTFLEAEVAKARKNALETDKASQFTMSGFSQTGDKYHSVKAAELTEKYLASLVALQKEIENAVPAVASTAKPVCYVEIVYDDGSNLAFTFANHAASLTHYLFVSKDSPLGKAILGKVVGESFSYKLDGGAGKKEFRGTITKLE